MHAAVPCGRQEKSKSKAGHAGFGAKTLDLTLLEVAPSGKNATEVGTVTLNLADFATTDPSAQATRALPVSAPAAITGAAAVLTLALHEWNEGFGVRRGGHLPIGGAAERRRALMRLALPCAPLRQA